MNIISLHNNTRCIWNPIHLGVRGECPSVLRPWPGVSFFFLQPFFFFWTIFLIEKNVFSGVVTIGRLCPCWGWQGHCKGGFCSSGSRPKFDPERGAKDAPVSMCPWLGILFLIIFPLIELKKKKKIGLQNSDSSLPNFWKQMGTWKPISRLHFDLGGRHAKFRQKYKLTTTIQLRCEWKLQRGFSARK